MYLILILILLGRGWVFLILVLAAPAIVEKMVMVEVQQVYSRNTSL